MPANAPGVDEVADGELPRQRVLQPLGVHHQVVVQEPRVGVERCHLLGAGLHHVWVTVAHWGWGLGWGREETRLRLYSTARPHPQNTSQSESNESGKMCGTCVCVFTVCDIVDAVQVALTFLVIHVLTFGFNYLYGVVAEEDLAGRPAEIRNMKDGRAESP